MKGLLQSNQISRDRLDSIADWIEEDVSSMTDQQAYEYLVGKCELMYSELLKVIAGKQSSLYPELNTYDSMTLNKCKGAICCLNIELDVSYVKAS